MLTLICTALLYIYIPKGFFPTQDTGVIQAITQAPQAAAYQAVAEQQQALAKKILQNPDVESLTSFISVDGTNITLKSGRMLINLKPRDDRSNTSTEIIRTIQSEVANIPDIKLYMQPVQDLTIDSTVSPTQYQFMLTDPNPSEFAEWVPKLIERLQHTDILTDVATDLQQNGQSVYIEIDRPTAARFGITPATVGRQCAVRRVRPTHHLDDLHAVEPVPRDSRIRAVRCSLQRHPERHLPAFVHRVERTGATVVHRDLP